jgi:putative phage-type endonuclease
MNILSAPQGSPEWFAARLGRVTASRVCDVVAKTKTGYSTSREGYMAELICERLTGKPFDQYTNADMQRGTELEPIARAMYELEKDCTVTQIGFVIHPTLDMAGASPDGLVGDGLIEIKCPRPHNHLNYIESGKAPAKYQAQMAWQCICTNRTWVDFISYCADMPEDLQLFVTRYTPELAYLKELEAEVTKFLEETQARMGKINQLRKEPA